MNEPQHHTVADGFRPPQLPPAAPLPPLTQLAAPAAFVVITGRTGMGKTYAAQGAARSLHCSGHPILILDPCGAWLPTARSFNWGEEQHAERRLATRWSVATRAGDPLQQLQQWVAEPPVNDPSQHRPLLILDHLGCFDRPEAAWLGAVLARWRQRAYPVWVIGQSIAAYGEVLAPHIAATPPRYRAHICFRQGPVPAGASLDMFPIVAPRQALLPVPLGDLAEGQSVTLVQTDTLVGAYLTERLVTPWQQRLAPAQARSPEPLRAPPPRVQKPGQKQRASAPGARDAGKPTT